MRPESASLETLEISSNFRYRIEERIARLERDAATDERMLAFLTDTDHLRRHGRLIAVQKAEAKRMRSFLDNARVRLPRPLIAL